MLSIQQQQQSQTEGTEQQIQPLRPPSPIIENAASPTTATDELANAVPSKLAESLPKTKDRFRRLPQSQAKGATPQTNPILNGQHMDVSSDIYKIYVQDSQAAQNRLEMHKTLSLLQIQQQISRSTHKDSGKFQGSTMTNPSPAKGVSHNQPATATPQQSTSSSVNTNPLVNPLSLTHQPGIIAQGTNKASSFHPIIGVFMVSENGLRKQQHQSVNHQSTPIQSPTGAGGSSQLQQTTAISNHQLSKIAPTNQRNGTGKQNLQSALNGLGSSTTPQSNYTQQFSSKIGAIESYSACYGGVLTSSTTKGIPPPRHTKKKQKHSRISAQGVVTGYEVYSRDTVSPVSNMLHSHQDGSDTFHSKQTYKQALNKSNDQTFSKVINGSPSNGKGRKRRAPSGINKIKLIGDKTIKQAIEVAAVRNEVLSQQNQKSVTPMKGMLDSGSVANELDMFIEKEDKIDLNDDKSSHFANRASLVENSKKLASEKSSIANLHQQCVSAPVPKSSHTCIVKDQQQLAASDVRSSAYDTATNQESFRDDNCESSRLATDRDQRQQLQEVISEQQNGFPEHNSQKDHIVNYLKPEEFIVACGQRGTSSQGRITRVQKQSQNAQAASSKKIISSYKKTIREKMLLDPDANHLFESNMDNRALNTDIATSVISPLRSYYRQPVTLSKKSIKRGQQQSCGVKGGPVNQPLYKGPGRKAGTFKDHHNEDLLERLRMMIDHLKDIYSKGQHAVSLDQAQSIFEVFGLISVETFAARVHSLFNKSNEVKLNKLIIHLEDFLRRYLEKEAAGQNQAGGADQARMGIQESIDGQGQTKTNFTLDSAGGRELGSPKAIGSSVQLVQSNTNGSSTTTPKQLKLIPGVGPQAGQRGAGVSNYISASAGAKPSMNSAFALSAKKQPQIAILIQEERIHQQHPVNKCIRLINQFAIEAFLKQNQAYFLPVQGKAAKAKNNKTGKTKFFSSQHYGSFNTTFMSQGNYQQMSPTAANNTCANVDMATVQSLAKQLQISLPKNGDLRSKAFICHAKEQMLTKLFDTLNRSNEIELDFKRQLFQHYRGYIGRGNNAQLLFQLFKQSRWWWNLYQAPQHDENGKVIMQHGQTSTQLLREDFKEHNFIFTQWKKMMHFNVLRNLKVREPAQAEELLPEKQDDIKSKNQQAKSNPATSRAMSPNTPGFRKKDDDIQVEQNLSNQWRIYAKMEANYHLSNKFALFFHMSKYYKSIDRDPFDVLPLTFHITKGSTDPVYFKFIQVFRQHEDNYNQELQKAQQDQSSEQQHEAAASNEAVQMCPRCQKQGNRSGLSRHETQKIDQQMQSNMNTSDISLPEFVPKTQPKAKKQNSFAESAAINLRTPARSNVLNQERQGSLARKMSLAVKTHQTANKAKTQNDTCSQCGLAMEDAAQSYQLCNAQSVSSLKPRSSLNQRGEDDENSGFKFSKGRFSAQKFDMNQQINSQRNHSTNKNENSIQKQGSLSRLHRRGVQFEEVAVKTTLTNQQQEGDKSGDYETSMSVMSNTNNGCGAAKASASFDQSTRLPAIRTGKNQLTSPALTGSDASNLAKQKTMVPSLAGSNPVASPKISLSRQSKFAGPLTLNEKISAQMTKNRLKRTPIQDADSLKKNAQKKQEKIIPNNIWIVKPGENSNRGNGITVCSTLREIKSILCQSDYDKQKTFIVQKYIERPALYNQRKFDIRCFAMLTLTNNKLKGYTYDNGYLRTSSRTFVNDDLSNKLIHLTNDAVQKKSDEYGRYESGNKLTFSDYQHYLDSNYAHLKIDFRSHIFSQIKQIMTDTFRATYKVVSPSRTLQHHTFEIFGFDFMLDENFKVYLIEVNTNPCLETTCPLLQKIITDVVDTGLRVALDPLYPPPNQQKRMNTQISVVQWQLSFDEELDAPTIEALQSTVLQDRKQNEAAGTQDTAEEDQAVVEEDLIQECEDEQEFD